MFFRLLIFALLIVATNVHAQPPAIEAGVPQTLAKWRAAHYSDVRYKLNITLEKGAPLMKGEIEVSVKLTNEGAKNDLILDWRTTQFANDKDKPFADVIAVNSTLIKESVPTGVFDYQTLKEHLIVSKKFLKTGENTIKIKFASPIKMSGAAITRYVDKEDGAEYIYSLFVPSDASTAFPVFDQPDLKARFKLNLIIPIEWEGISNTTPKISDGIIETHRTIGDKKDHIIETSSYNELVFPETKPISTYVFAFATGEFDEFVEGYNEPTRKLQLDKWTDEEVNKVLDPKKQRVWVRKSQAEKFKQHSEEVFRLNREGVRFLESYFDYKFPFPKYDLVLIPEFPFGGMEHAGATFLRESSVIFPTEPTKNDYVSRANVIFHEAAHQWFGDTVTMKWFDDLWLKEGFAEFMAYKTLEKVMPEYNAWKIFYERNKQAAYLTDATKGTTPIYQEIPNLSAAKSAYGNIVYRKAPSFLKQAEFYLGEKEFQIAVRSFLKKHEFANAEWTDLVNEFETVSKRNLKEWGERWIKQRGVPVLRVSSEVFVPKSRFVSGAQRKYFEARGNLKETSSPDENQTWLQKSVVLFRFSTGATQESSIDIGLSPTKILPNGETFCSDCITGDSTDRLGTPLFVFPNYQDYGYGIFLLDERSRAYVLENIQTEKDDFLRTMMWGSLWDSVREDELNPKDYVALVIKNINVETDESTIQTLLSRVSTAMNYYLSDKQRDEFTLQIEAILIDKMRNAPTLGQKITFYRSFLNTASSEKAKNVLKEMLNSLAEQKPRKVKVEMAETYRQNKNARIEFPPLKTKDKFDIVMRLLILGEKDAPALLATLESTETSDEAKRYAYAAKAGIATAENKAKFWNDFVNNKEISESWIEAAFAPFNSVRHSNLTLPYLEKALAELPNLKKNRKIFFVNGWLSAFIGGQKSEEALKVVNKFLAANPNLDRDLRLKILENADALERAVKIRAKFRN